MPHLVATLIYLSQIHSYYIRGDMSPLTHTELKNFDINYGSQRIIHFELFVPFRFICIPILWVKFLTHITL